jgi:hypothetical protein
VPSAFETIDVAVGLGDAAVTAGVCDGAAAEADAEAGGAELARSTVAQPTNDTLTRITRPWAIREFVMRWTPFCCW